MSEHDQPDPSGPEPSPAPAPAPDPAPAPEPSPAADAPITAREAADLIAAKPAADESADEADTAARKEPRGETDAAEPQSESLKPPRSWSKEDKQAFSLLPREAQERILTRDRQRELDVSRALNEAAQQRQAAEAVAQQAQQAQAQARAQYERNLPQKALLMDAQYRAEFGTPTWDQIQSWADRDQPKYVRWQAAYARATAVADELRQAQAQQQAQAHHQQQQELHQFVQTAEAWKADEARKFQEAAPEWKDPKQYQARVAEVLEYMEEVGFPREDLQRFANEFVPINVHDHRFQLIIRDGLRYRKATRAAKSPSRRPVPPVQRPGSAPSRGEAGEARLRDLNQQLDRTGNARDAARLIAALGSRRS